MNSPTPRAEHTSSGWRRAGEAPWPLLLAGLTLSFSLFGLASFNLFLMLRANLRFIGEHGIDALAAGGAIQLVLLGATAYFAMGSYTVTKWFELRLMQRMEARPPWRETLPAPASGASTAPRTRTRHNPPPARRPSSARLRKGGARPGRNAPR